MLAVADLDGVEVAVEGVHKFRLPAFLVGVADNDDVAPAVIVVFGKEDDAVGGRAFLEERRESIEQFEKGNRVELAAKERQEITILESYLPQAFSPEQLSTVVDTVIQETGARSLKEMGAVMKAVMVRVAGQPVDGKQISDLVRAKLQ